MAIGLAVAGACGVVPSVARGGLSGSNTVEAQIGNVPFVDPENRFGVYGQLNLDYATGRARVGLRFESDRNSEDMFTYDEITLRYAEWSDGSVRVRAGNYYTLLGRGLVHRSFELPGVILDEPGARSRYAPSRDVDGLLVEGQMGPISGKFLAGSPNGGTVSPGSEETGLARYSGQLAGGEIASDVYRGSRAGFTYARYTPDGQIQQEFGSGFIEIDPLALLGSAEVVLPSYFEYAGLNATFSDWWKLETSDETPHALYASTNLLWGPLGVSAEWKDYSRFRTGTNDPPSLVKEHSWPLLNRSTHILDAELEEGFQLEASITQPGWGSFTANLSRSDGRRGSEPARFEEKHFEIHLAPDHGKIWEATLFGNLGKDELFSVLDREAYGGTVTYRILDEYSATLDYERQPMTRGPESFSDTYLSVSAAWANRATVSLVWERTTDPFEEDPAEALEPPVEPRNFLGVNVRGRISDAHDITVFYGERRGGNACTAGSCYEVLSLRGLEIRLSSLF